MQVERGVFTVAKLDHTGNADEVHPAAEVETADDRRARQDQDREVLVTLDQRMGDRPAAAQVAEAESVVAVNQHATVLAARSCAVAHARSLMVSPPSGSAAWPNLKPLGI